MMCIYCKGFDAERGDDGLALCADCVGRFTEGSPQTAPIKTEVEYDAEWERQERADADAWHAEQDRREWRYGR